MEERQYLKESAMMHSYTRYNKEKLDESKKRAVTHCLNLECKKEQLLILVKKLNTISGQRLDFHSETKGILHAYGVGKSSIPDELKSARTSLDVVDIEIKNARHQLKVMEKVLKDKQIQD